MNNPVDSARNLLQAVRDGTMSPEVVVLAWPPELEPHFNLCLTVAQGTVSVAEAVHRLRKVYYRDLHYTTYRKRRAWGFGIWVGLQVLCVGLAALQRENWRAWAVVGTLLPAMFVGLSDWGARRYAAEREELEREFEAEEARLPGNASSRS